jgi:tellurite resistance protein
LPRLVRSMFAMDLVQVDLSRFGAERLRGAVEAAISGATAGTLPTATRLVQGAKATLASSDDDVSTYFVSILEIAYLVASADGFADEERAALSLLLEGVTGRAVGHDLLEVHFKDLDNACEMLGRHERLRRAAEDFADAAIRTEALGFAAIVAMADGKLAEPELNALVELGGYLGFTRDQVAELVHSVVNRLRAELETA